MDEINRLMNAFFYKHYPGCPVNLLCALNQDSIFFKDLHYFKHKGIWQPYSGKNKDLAILKYVIGNLEHLYGPSKIDCEEATISLIDDLRRKAGDQGIKGRKGSLITQANMGEDNEILMVFVTKDHSKRDKGMENAINYFRYTRNHRCNYWIVQLPPKADRKSILTMSAEGVAKILYKLSVNKKPLEEVWKPGFITIKDTCPKSINVHVKNNASQSISIITASEYSEALNISEPKYELIKIGNGNFVIFFAIDSYKLVLSIEYILKMNEQLNLHNSHFVMLNDNNEFLEILLNSKRKRIEDFGNSDVGTRLLSAPNKDEVLRIFEDR